MERVGVLLGDANRQVQIADHLLTATFPTVKDPKILLSVLEHCRRAIEDACEAVVSYHLAHKDYELPKIALHDGKQDIMVAFDDLLKVRKPEINAAKDALLLHHDIRVTLQQYKEAPTAFTREEKLVIAGEGFSYLKEVTPIELSRSLRTLKQFVHSCNQYILR